MMFAQNYELELVFSLLIFLRDVRWIIFFMQLMLFRESLQRLVQLNTIRG
jgi:hypothetical protein